MIREVVAWRVLASSVVELCECWHRRAIPTERARDKRGAASGHQAVVFQCIFAKHLQRAYRRFSFKKLISRGFSCGGLSCERVRL